LRYKSLSNSYSTARFLAAKYNLTELDLISIDGLKVRVFERGRGNSVIFLHGLGGSIESWTNNLDSISADARVFALDLPGFGQSSKPRISYSISFYRDFLIKFIKHVGLPKASLVGSSLGGHIACELAIARPELLDKLVLVSPAGALPRSFKASPALNRYIKVTSAHSVEEVKRALFAVDKKPVNDAYARLVFERFSEPNAKEAFLSALKGSSSATRLQPRLGRIRATTLLIWGKEDIMIPVKFVKPFMQMKNCRVVMLERCGHRPHAERPLIFNEMVSGFLKEGA
jgi:2-hydroxy-6-oxonona-2,4-dienedioate hydrolase